MSLKACRIEHVFKQKEIKSNYKQKIAELEESTGNTFIEKLGLAVSYFAFSGYLWLKLFFCYLKAIVQLVPIWFKEIGRFCPKPYFDPILSPALIIGHRGAAAHEIENTLEACQKAVEAYGANALEVDFCLTKDEQLVLWHDWDPNTLISRVRQAGLEPDVKYRPFVPMGGEYRRAVHELTLSELRAHYGYTLKKKYPEKLLATIPTLDELFEWATGINSLSHVYLDCKLPDDHVHFAGIILKEIDNCVKKYNPQFNIVILTPEAAVLQEFKKHPFDFNYALDSLLPYGWVLEPEAYSAVEKARKYSNRWASAGRPAVLDLSPWTSYRRLLKHDFDLIDENNSQTDDQENILCWTINKRREQKCLLKLGASAIVTDHPERLSKYVRKNE